MANGDDDYRYPGAYPMQQWGGYPPPPPGWYPPQQGYYPPQQQQQQQPDMSGQLMGLLIPMLTTIPALKSSKAVTTTIISNLTTLGPAPTTTNAVPTQNEFNALAAYAQKLRDNLQAAVNNDQAVFAQMSQAVLLQVLIPMLSNPNNMGGMNSMMLIVLMIAFGGFFGS